MKSKICFLSCIVFVSCTYSCVHRDNYGRKIYKMKEEKLIVEKSFISIETMIEQKYGYEAVKKIVMNFSKRENYFDLKEISYGTKVVTCKKRKELEDCMRGNYSSEAISHMQKYLDAGCCILDVTCEGDDSVMLVFDSCGVIVDFFPK